MIGFDYSVSDEQLLRYSRAPLQARLEWLEGVRTTTWQLADDATRASWDRARGKTHHPMPVSLPLDGHAVGRVWRGDADTFAYPSEKVLERSVVARGSAAQARSLSLEFARHVGPRFVSALLGGTYVPGAGQQLLLRLHVEARSGPIWPGALSVDATSVGLPEWAADALANSAEVCSRLGPGTLDIDRAAHDEIASSPDSFVQALTALVAALSAPLDLALEALRDALSRRPSGP
jgi:hypothetical protein